MSKTINLLVLMALMVVAFIGCSSTGDMVEPQSFSQSDLGQIAYSNKAAAVLPGTTFESVMLYVYASSMSTHTVSIHRITADWVETEVTWNNFGGSFDATVTATFNSDSVGWYAIDITSLFQNWSDGTYDNFGILLEQTDNSYPRTVLHSRQNLSNQPYIEICYDMGGSVTCEMLAANADAYIYELYPDANTGLSEVLNIGWYNETDKEKQALIKFDMPEEIDYASLGDTVWIDENQNGIQDADEPGFPEVTVNLYNCEDVLIATTMTDANGFYLFDNLIPGDYYVEFIEPEGYDFTMQDQGTDDMVDSDADPSTGMTTCTTLDSGENDMSWDAGLYLIPMEGCSLTIGFWKNHGGFGPQADVVTPLLPIWLGDPSGDESIYVDNGQLAHDILTQKVYGDPSNAITKMMAQMLAAKLNIANGAAGSAIGSEISDADEFLADYNWTDWDDLSKKMMKEVRKLHSTFDDYNNGDIGPGHCD